MAMPEVLAQLTIRVFSSTIPKVYTVSEKAAARCFSSTHFSDTTQQRCIVDSS
jgi:hypothetical protein